MPPFDRLRDPLAGVAFRFYECRLRSDDSQILIEDLQLDAQFWAMAVTCVFCGRPPQDKTAEHVVPRWLMELTGDPDRKAGFGPNYRKGTGTWDFAFDAFKFPACDSCNGKYSAMEGSTKTVVEKLLAGSDCTVGEFDLLLDWLDKVRIGLWLGLTMLNGNPLGIQPNFHIDQRVGRKDRVLVICRAAPVWTSLRVFGSGSPCFNIGPSCFAVVVNHVALISISMEYIIASRVGFPAPRALRLRPDGLRQVEFRQASQVTLPRLLSYGLPSSSFSLCQPIFAFDSTVGEDREPARPVEYYNNEYCRTRSIDFAGGKGALFFEDEGRVEYAADPTRVLKWQRPYRNRSDMLFEIALAVHRIQAELQRGTGDLSLLTKEERQDIRKSHRERHVAQRKLIRFILEGGAEQFAKTFRPGSRESA